MHVPRSALESQLVMPAQSELLGACSLSFSLLAAGLTLLEHCWQPGLVGEPVQQGHSATNGICTFRPLSNAMNAAAASSVTAGKQSERTGTAHGLQTLDARHVGWTMQSRILFCQGGTQVTNPVRSFKVEGWVSKRRRRTWPSQLPPALARW